MTSVVKARASSSAHLQRSGSRKTLDDTTKSLRSGTLVGALTRPRMQSSGWTQYRHSKIRTKPDTPGYVKYAIRTSAGDLYREALLLSGLSLVYQRIIIFAKHIPWSILGDEEDGLGKNFDDYMAYFNNRLEVMKHFMHYEAFTKHHISGVWLMMGDYTMLVLEGIEDQIGLCCQELTRYFDNYWLLGSVFQVEDKIDKAYFEKLYTRMASPIHVNEKFPTSAADDYEFMSSMHWKLKERMHELLTTLANGIDKLAQNSEDPLPPEEFNHLLPEVQRMELIFGCKRFYQHLREYTKTYEVVPNERDEEDTEWPSKFSYMPYNVFKRVEYDVNVTFAEYKLPRKQRLALEQSRQAEEMRLLREEGEELGEEEEAYEGDEGTEFESTVAVGEEEHVEEDEFEDDGEDEEIWDQYGEMEEEKKQSVVVEKDEEIEEYDDKDRFADFDEIEFEGEELEEENEGDVAEFTDVVTEATDIELKPEDSAVLMLEGQTLATTDGNHKELHALSELEIL